MRLSVVIPVRNDAELLARCLSALRPQTRPADEVIVVDNASSDASAAVAADGGARVLSCPEPGIPAAAAAGYDAAGGDLILRLDADCIPPRTWIQDTERLLSRSPGMVAATGWARFVDGPGALRWTVDLYLGAYTIAAWTALGHRPLFGSNMALRADAWRAVRTEVHRHDAETHDDLDLSFHLGRIGAIGRLTGVRMGISMRPLRPGSGLRRRVRRGLHTVTLHWPEDLPPWRRRRLRELR
ncbi:glycosyltransferase family 2 protein [Microbacterium esteraromaticum]|uniref:4,4'-diaponeurosporenoate glycosyltransferase n=1 Tax=Microbacterium esteraromaticum TaxID=57043 RepID=A0A7D8AMT8_9MICO|nr:glycosyltransferase family A protein [Microbacterium esteraromaticum]QMU98128.1 glycosyltransferase family 2 protein [Microbacterium esteraromaticum]